MWLWESCLRKETWFLSWNCCFSWQFTSTNTHSSRFGSLLQLCPCLISDNANAPSNHTTLCTGDNYAAAPCDKLCSRRPGRERKSDYVIDIYLDRMKVLQALRGKKCLAEQFLLGRQIDFKLLHGWLHVLTSCFARSCSLWHTHTLKTCTADTHPLLSVLFMINTLNKDILPPSSCPPSTLTHPLSLSLSPPPLCVPACLHNSLKEHNPSTKWKHKGNLSSIL